MDTEWQRRHIGRLREDIERERDAEQMGQGRSVSLLDYLAAKLEAEEWKFRHDIIVNKIILAQSLKITPPDFIIKTDDLHPKEDPE